MTYAETVPSWFLLNLKLVQVTWNIGTIDYYEYLNQCGGKINLGFGVSVEKKNVGEGMFFRM